MKKNSIFVFFCLLSYGIGLLSSVRAVEGQPDRPRMEHKSTQTDVVFVIDTRMTEERRQRQDVARNAAVLAGNKPDGLSLEISR